MVAILLICNCTADSLCEPETPTQPTCLGLELKGWEELKVSVALLPALEAREEESLDRGGGGGGWRASHLGAPGK